jgi:broad specificity phosphatase PhoE
MENRYPDYEGESWAGFRDRIRECAEGLFSDQQERAIAIFTSATPIAILAGAALALTDEKLLSVLGVLYNTGVTVMKSRGSDLRLFTLNATPHLNPQMRTLR